MDWCSVYLTPEGLPKYIYLSPPLIFPTTYNGIRTKNRPVWITSGAAPIHWMGPIRNPRWEQKRTEGYVIVSSKIFATSAWDLTRSTSFSSLQRSNWTPTYILHLFHLEDTSLLFLFISESVKVRFLPRVDSFSSDMLFIVYKLGARSRRVHIEDQMNRFEFLSSRTIITITIVLGLFCQKIVSFAA
jgi:hypothetical protein